MPPRGAGFYRGEGGDGRGRGSGEHPAQARRAAEERAGLVLGHPPVLVRPHRFGPGPGPGLEEQVLGLTADQVGQRAA